MKTVLTISRKWHMPQIETTLAHDGIELKTNLDNFIEALVQELGPVRWVFTDQTFRIKLDAAIERVLQGIKEESAKVV
jgi:hypothetical protein